MSKVDLNALVNGFSGKLGNAVLRKRNGITRISQKPAARTRPATEAELAQRKRFKRAAAYAKARLQDEAIKAEYQELALRKGNMTAFTMAVTDFLKAPQIDKVIADSYKGNIGDAIVMEVTDGFKIKTMHVEIVLPDGSVLEEGSATVAPTEIDWVYVATAINGQLAGSKIRVTGTDRPGNKVVIEKMI